MHITGGSTSQRSPASSGFHGGTDDQPPALTSELPTDPQQRPGLQEPLPKCQLLELRDHLPGQGWPLPLLHRRLSSSEGLLFSRPGPRRPSSPAMPEPSLHPSARFPCLIFPTGAFSRVCQFPPPGGPLLRLPSPRQSLQGRGCLWVRKPSPPGPQDMHPAVGGGELPGEPAAYANLSRIRFWSLHQGRGCLGPPHPWGPRNDIPPPQSSPAPWGYRWGGCPYQRCPPQQGEERVAGLGTHGATMSSASGT